MTIITFSLKHLADGQQAFSFGCDTQLGNSSTSGSYSDRAALNAMVKNGVLQQVAMIGAGTVNEAADTDPAFVIAPVDPASRFWIGNFSSRQTYAYNISGGTATETIDGQNVVTLLEGADSGMTMSWMNIPSGGSVRFRFSVGDVAHTGAVSGKVDYENEKLTGLEPNTVYTITDPEGDSHTITSNENGEISLSGEDDEGESYDLAGKTITVAKQGSEDTPAEIEIEGRPETPEKPSDLEEGESTTPTVDSNIEIVELTTTSVTISPKPGQQYAWSADGTNWTTLISTNAEGNYLISDLTDGSTVKIRTRLAATSEAPASKWSEPKEIQLKSTVKVSASGWSGSYDGGVHSISVSVTSPTDGATVMYSSTSDNNYSETNPVFDTAGEHIVYYRATAEGCYPAYGSATVNIQPIEIGIEWGESTFTYDGKSHKPTAEVTGLLPGEDTEVIVEGEQTNAGTNYLATAVGLSNPNYKLPETGTTKTFSIAQKKLTMQWGNTYLTYNGKIQYPNVILIGLEEGDEVTAVIGGGQINVNTVGTYEAQVNKDNSLSGKDAGNYVLEAKDEQLKHRFKIYPKKITAGMVTADTSYVYTGNDISPSITVKDGDTTLSEGGDYTLSGDVSGKEVKNDYKVTVTGKGNYIGTVDVIYKITDSQPPTGTIKVAANQWQELLNSLSFGIFYKEKQTVTITAEDEGSGVDTVSYFLTTKAEPMDDAALAAMPESKWNSIANGGSFTINPDNQYVIYAKITDKSGNVTFISSNGIVVDKTAPVITGIENNKTYCAGVTFTVTDTVGLASVKIDDDEKGIDGSYQISAGLEKTTHTIVAADTTGNSRTYSITVNAYSVDNGHSFGEWTEITPATCEEKGTESHICSACGLVETREIEKKGHKYATGENDAHFIWTAEKDTQGIVTGYKATAYFVCEHDITHTKTADSCSVKRELTKSATETEEGEVTYTATAEYGGKGYKAIKTTKLAKLNKLSDSESGNENSNIYTSTSVAENAPNTIIGKELNTTLAKDLLTSAEKAIYNDDSVATDVTVYLEVQNISGAVDSDEKKQVEDLITETVNSSKNNQTESGAAYVDLSMYKNVTTKKDDTVTSDTTTQITDTGKDITITMGIPQDFPEVDPGFTRSYKVIRVHDGVAEQLEITAQTANHLSFKTSNFLPMPLSMWIRRIQVLHLLPVVVQDLSQFR